MCGCECASTRLYSIHPRVASQQAYFMSSIGPLRRTRISQTRHAQNRGICALKVVTGDIYGCCGLSASCCAQDIVIIQKHTLTHACEIYCMYDDALAPRVRERDLRTYIFNQSLRAQRRFFLPPPPPPMPPPTLICARRSVLPYLINTRSRVDIEMLVCLPAHGGAL